MKMPVGEMMFIVPILIFIPCLDRQKNCHKCNLILGQITPDTVRHLQHDLDQSRIIPSEQICVRIKGKRSKSPIVARYFEIVVRNGPLFRGCRPSRRDGWVVIGELTIQFAGESYTNKARSTAVSNCSNDTIVRITYWLGKCTVSHPKCFEIQTVALTQDVLPTRLLDLGFVKQQGSVRLIMSRSLPQDTVYATLSHCWGGGCEKTLTVDSLEEFEKGLLVDSIPKTFRDAVFVTTELGIKYLWIDALCIVQDSVDDLEWRQEASIMGDVYANSYVTLAATTSSNPRGGLVHQRNPLSVWPCRLTATWRCFVPGELIVSSGALSRDSDMIPLCNRAWAFQEWLLSKRLIHFSNDQVRWECYCLAASELYPDGLDESDQRDQGSCWILWTYGGIRYMALALFYISSMYLVPL